ncbi:MAG: LptA/OstA family protein [Candidatus Hydrogenedentota bacterium]
MRKLLLISVVFLLLGNTGIALEVEKIQINHSDEMIYDGIKHTLEYTGSVDVTSDQMELKGERVILYFNEKEDEIIKAEAFGNVYMKKDEFTAEAGKVIYETQNGKITLEEKPVVYGEGKKLKADFIIYFVKEKRIDAKGNVSGFFIPQKKKKKEDESTKS